MTETAAPTSSSTAPTSTSTTADPISPNVAVPAWGKVVEQRDSVVLFRPRGTNYELHLEAPDYNGPVNKPVQGVVRVRGRKAYTVPSGGNLIVPLMGTPRIVQGRVLDLMVPEKGPRLLVLKAGAIVIAELPDEPHAIDLSNGPIEQGAIVNVVVWPGARFSLVG